MASLGSVQKVVRTLCSAHSREPKQETFDAYNIALADYSDSEVGLGLTTALREPREFMPPPGIVAGFARDARNAHIRRSQAIDERRINCVVCMDRGSVLILNRQWLLEHRDQFTAEWFVAGWMRQAEMWCRNNCQPINGASGRKSLFWPALCFCECRLAKVFRKQASQYLAALKANTLDEKKTPRPAFGVQCDPDKDCVVRAKDGEQCKIAVLDWTKRDSDGRTWTGNWNP